MMRPLKSGLFVAGIMLGVAMSTHAPIPTIPTRMDVTVTPIVTLRPLPVATNPWLFDPAPYTPNHEPITTIPHLPAHEIRIDFSAPGSLEIAAGIIAFPTDPSLHEEIVNRITMHNTTLYPPRFLEDICGVRTIRVLENLEYRDESVYGIAPKGGTVYLDSRSLHDERFPLEVVLTHENHHHCDHAHMGEAIVNQWAAKNQERSYAYTEDWRTIPHAPGFGRPYGLKNVYEDRATIAERIFHPATHQIDPLYQWKLRDIISFYERISEGMLDHQYFLARQENLPNRVWEHVLDGR